MDYRDIAAIDRTVQNYYHPQSEVDRIRLELMPAVDLDDDQLELFASYLADLKQIGVDLTSERLQETLNAYPENMEAAIEAVIEYADRLRQKQEEFKDQFHATNCLTKALAEGWKPTAAN